MADVFVSYAKADADFVRQMFNGLHQEIFDIWLDWADGTYGSGWWEEIKAGIESASTFVCVLSPHWAASDRCQLEVAYAIQLKKRLIPVLFEPVDPGQVVASNFGKPPRSLALPELTSEELAQLFHNNWKVISTYNWVFHGGEFESFITSLIQTIKTDLEHDRKHTHYLMNAKKWDERGRKTEYLLQGESLVEAVAWLERSESKNPQPTDLHRQFIQEGHQRLLKQKQSLLARWGNLLKSVLPVGPRKVFISYRRADAPDACGRIYDRLKPVFGEKNVFLDVDTIELGTDFSQYIQQTLTECFAVLAVIGPKWLEILKERAKSDDPDYVRIELEIALKRHHVNVIPLFVSGASPLDPDELPPSLKNLAVMNGTAIRAGRDFHKDMNTLIEELKKLRTQAKQEHTRE